MKRFELTVWGARGSVPAPAADGSRFGTETSCIEVRCGERTLVLDAGTGIIACGRKLLKEKVVDFDILLTHCHFDHVIGLPFMAPLYHDTVTARIHAGHFLDQTSCRNMVERFMCPPYFPVTPKQFSATVDYCDFRPPDVLDLKNGIEVRTLRLDHPDGAVGYRIAFEGRVFSYVTDTESRPGAQDEAVVDFIAGSDIVMYDCMFTDAELTGFRGFGHSTWQEGVRLCRAAGVEHLVIHHHDFSRTDAWLAALQEEARAEFPGSLVGGTGLSLSLGESVDILQGI